MKIAYDAKRLFHNYTGLGNYSRTLVKNLAELHPMHDYRLYSPTLKNNEETAFFLNSKHFQTHTSPTLFKSWWRTKGIVKDLVSENVDIFHGLSHEIPVGLNQTNIKSVVTIHDLIFKVYPTFFPWIDRQIYDWKFRHACEKADKIIAISEHTKQDIIRFYRMPSEKIEVIYQTCQEQFKQMVVPEQRLKIIEKYQIPQDFLLYVGSITERKNLLSIIQALEILPQDLKLPLIVIGGGGTYKKQVQAYISTQGLEKYVYFLNIDFQELPTFYQQARIFIYPSVYEGFGIPIMEALYSQTPVITTRVSSLPEAGGDAAFYVDEPNAESIAEGIKQLLGSEVLRQKMIEKGNFHLKKFDKKLLSEQLMNLYENL